MGIQDSFFKTGSLMRDYDQTNSDQSNLVFKIKIFFFLNAGSYSVRLLSYSITFLVCFLSISPWPGRLCCFFAFLCEGNYILHRTYFARHFYSRGLWNNLVWTNPPFCVKHLCNTSGSTIIKISKYSTVISYLGIKNGTSTTVSNIRSCQLDNTWLMSK